MSTVMLNRIFRFLPKRRNYIKDQSCLPLPFSRLFTFVSTLHPHTAQVVTAIAVITDFVVAVVFFAHVHVLDMDLYHII